MSRLTLPSKLLALHDALDDAGIAHAFGGAIALAYCTGEPRGTVDIDLNLFLDSSGARRVFDVLPTGVATDDKDVAAVLADGQVRLFWDTTPVDLFFAYHPFHAEVADRIRLVPFAETVVPVLSCEDLLIFKAFFSRTRTGPTSRPCWPSTPWTFQPPATGWPPCWAPTTRATALCSPFSDHRPTEFLADPDSPDVVPPVDPSPARRTTTHLTGALS